MTQLLRRSELAVPASNDNMFDKAAGCGADLVFLDLEDAVPPAFKEESRGKAISALNDLDWGRTARAVRINGLDTPWCHDDLIEVVTAAGRNLDTVIIPKARRARDVWWVDVLLSQLEAKLNLGNKIRLEVLIEEVEGLANAEEIAVASPRLGALIFGVGDFSLSQGAGGHQLRAAGRISWRFLAIRPQQGDRRRAHRGHRRDRRALSRLPRPGGI